MVKFLSQVDLDLHFISYISLNMLPVNYQMRSSLVQTFYKKNIKITARNFLIREHVIWT